MSLPYSLDLTRLFNSNCSFFQSDAASGQVRATRNRVGVNLVKRTGSADWHVLHAY